MSGRARLMHHPPRKPTMVRYYDDRGVFEAPLDSVWRMIGEHTDENMPALHPDLTSRTVRQEGDTIEREVDARTPEGGRDKMRMLFTARPPRTLTIDYLEGAMKGSWVTNTYIPEGPDKTRVIATGEFHIAGEDDEEARRDAGRMLDQRFDEDARWLKDHR